MGTAEEAKQEYISAMGKQLGTQYAELWQEIAHLHLTWLEFVELFGTKQSRVKLLNRTAGGFFRIVQERLWEAVALHIARLTDPSNSFGRSDKTNLTLLNLPELILDAVLQKDVTRLCDKALATSAFARDWRNRHIAHRDLSLALSGNARALPAVSKEQVNAALEALVNIMNAVARHYLNSTTSFKHIARVSGAMNLLYVIDDGLKFDMERERRIESGDLSDFSELNRDL